MILRGFLKIAGFFAREPLISKTFSAELLIFSGIFQFEFQLMTRNFPCGLLAKYAKTYSCILGNFCKTNAFRPNIRLRKKLWCERKLRTFGNRFWELCRSTLLGRFLQLPKWYANLWNYSVGSCVFFLRTRKIGNTQGNFIVTRLFNIRNSRNDNAWKK